MEVLSRPEKIPFGGLEVASSLCLQFLLARPGHDDSVSVCVHLALEGPATWLSLKHGLDVDCLRRLRELSKKRRDWVGAQLVRVVDFFLVELLARSGSRSGGGGSRALAGRGAGEVADIEAGSRGRVHVALLGWLGGGVEVHGEE